MSIFALSQNGGFLYCKLTDFPVDKPVPVIYTDVESSLIKTQDRERDSFTGSSLLS